MKQIPQIPHDVPAAVQCHHALWLNQGPSPHNLALSPQSFSNQIGERCSNQEMWSEQAYIILKHRAGFLSQQKLSIFSKGPCCQGDSMLPMAVVKKVKARQGFCLLLFFWDQNLRHCALVDPEKAQLSQCQHQQSVRWKKCDFSVASTRRTTLGCALVGRPCGTEQG